jgi:hypothetical protein
VGSLRCAPESGKSKPPRAVISPGFAIAGFDDDAAKATRKKKATGSVTAAFFRKEKNSVFCIGGVSFRTSARWTRTLTRKEKAASGNLAAFLVEDQ